jgi:hypothetical protein
MLSLKHLCLPLLLLITSCGIDNEEITSIDNPKLVTVAFFDAIYNEKDIKKAASVCDDKLAKLVLHYRTSSAVGRHLFNMSYDNVVVKPDESGVKVREQFKGSAIVTVYFNGYYNDKNVKDVKLISLIQKDGKWLIDKILKDPF